MKTAKKIILIIMILTANFNIFCAQYIVINNGSQPVTVKIDTEDKDGNKKTLTKNNLETGDSSTLEALGKTRKATVIYLLPSTTKQGLRLNALFLENGTNREHDKLNVNFDANTNYTIELSSKPNSKMPGSLIWFIKTTKE